MSEYYEDLFEQVRDGERHIEPIDRETAKAFIERIHYSRILPSNVVYRFGLYEERKNGIDPQRFVDWYQARGWKNIKDWKACVRTWEQRNKKPVVDEADDYFWKAVKEMQNE